MGWRGWLRHSDGAELHHRTEEEPHTLPHEGYYPLCAHHRLFLLLDAGITRMAYAGSTGLQYALHRPLCGIYHLSGPSIEEPPCYWKIFQKIA